MLEVNTNKCIHCRQCGDVCPSGAIDAYMGVSKMNGDLFCIKCFHCAAVCPQDAILFGGDAAIEKSSEYSPGVEAAILNRRSFRNFRNEIVPKEIIEEAINISRWAPSAKNQHPTKWIVINDENVISFIMDTILKFVKDSGKNPEILEERKYGKNVVLGNAKNLILSYARCNAIEPHTDSVIATTMVELYLQDKGLGTCWAGYLKNFLNEIPALKEYFNLPDNNAFYTAMLVGYPKEEYSNIPVRVKKSNIEWIIR